MKSRFSLVFMCLVASIVISVFSSTQTTNAQLVPVSVNVLQLSISPKNPGPGQSTTVTVASYAADISSATMIWSVDGVIIKKGIGLTTFTTQAPKLGKTLNVRVDVTTASGQQYNESLPIKSGGVDFITESSGYTPPFFLGRVPIAYQNTVRIVAIPHLANSSGVEYSPSSLVYKWEKDSGEILADQSGYGKNFVDLKGNIIPRPYSLTVTVTTKDGSNTTEGDVSIVPQKPSLEFYVNDPLYGPLYNTAVSTVGINTQKEVSVLAVPFGFDKALNSLADLVLDWSINGTSNSDLDSSNNVVLRSPDNSSGSSDIAININSKNELLQSTSGSFTVNFNNTIDSTSTTSNPVAF